jgi:hypothetical protein
MTETMSKAQRVRALLAEGKPHQEIADEVGCLRSYVRTVRLRAASEDGMSPGERAWRERNAERVKEFDRKREVRRRESMTPQQRARHRDLQREYYRRRAKNDPIFREKRRILALEGYHRRKEEINAKRRERQAERRAIVAAMIEVAYAKT